MMFQLMLNGFSLKEWWTYNDNAIERLLSRGLITSVGIKR